MIADDKQIDLLWEEIQASRDFIGRQIRNRFYLIGAAFTLAFVLLLPLDAPLQILTGIAASHGVDGVQVERELLSTLIWFCWSTAVLQAGSRSVVVTREARHIRMLETRASSIAGPIITRHTDFAATPSIYLRGAEFAYVLAFSGATLLVGGYRLYWELTAGWNRIFFAVDAVLFVGTLVLLVLAVRDLARP